MVQAMNHACKRAKKDGLGVRRSFSGYALVKRRDSVTSYLYSVDSYGNNWHAARVSEAALKALGEAIRARRGEINGLSQEGLADLAGMHRTYVSEIERGLRNPSFRNLFKIAAALEMPLSELVARAERIVGGQSLA